MSAFHNFINALRGNKERRSPDPAQQDDVSKTVRPLKRHARSQSEGKKTRVTVQTADVRAADDVINAQSDDVLDVMREKTMSLDRKRKWGVHQFDDVTSQAGAQSTRDVVEEEEEGREKRSNSVRKRKFHFNILRRANSLQHGSDRHRHSTAASSSASGASSDVSLAHNSASASHDLNTGSDSKDGMTSSASTVQSDCARQLSPIEDVLVQSADALSPDSSLEGAQESSDEAAAVLPSGGASVKQESGEKKKKEKKKYRKKRGSFFDIFFHRHQHEKTEKLETEQEPDDEETVVAPVENADTECTEQKKTGVIADVVETITVPVHNPDAHLAPESLLATPPATDVQVPYMTAVFLDFMIV